MPHRFYSLKIARIQCTLLSMKKKRQNITFSAESALIEEARAVTSKKGITLNEAFRVWLESLVNSKNSAFEYKSLMKALNHVNSGRKFSRDELNER